MSFFISLFGSFSFLAPLVIFVLAFLIVKNKRKCKDLEWELNFTQLQLRYLEWLQGIEPNLPVCGEETNDEGFVSGQE